jgi:hypothetical protein
MLSFKHYLKEYVTEKQKAKLKDTYGPDVEISDKARSETDHFFGKGNDKIVEPLLNYDHNLIDKSEPHRKIEQHLGRPISNEDYMDGKVSDSKYPNRKVRIGSLIKDPKLRDEFANDSVRAGMKKGTVTSRGFTVTIHRGIEVAGQTNTEHSWSEQSCKNVETGSNREYLPDEIHHGTVVGFVHDESGKEIYRFTLHPHHRLDPRHGSPGDVMYSLNSEYGIKHPAFTAHAHHVAERLSGGYKPGMYRIHPAVYNDTDRHIAIHPASTPEHIGHILNTSEIHDELAAAAAHPRLTSDHVTQILNKEGRRTGRLKITALNSPAANEQHVTMGLSSNDPNVRYSALYHPKLNGHHLTHALNTPYSDLHYWALSHPKIESHHLMQGLNNEDLDTKLHALASPKIQEHHIDHLLKDPNDLARIAALAHRKATISHYEHAAANDPHPDVRATATKLMNAYHTVNKNVNV